MSLPHPASRFFLHQNFVSFQDSSQTLGSSPLINFTSLINNPQPTHFLAGWWVFSLLIHPPFIYFLHRSFSHDFPFHRHCPAYGLYTIGLIWWGVFTRYDSHLVELAGERFWPKSFTNWLAHMGWTNGYRSKLKGVKTGKFWRRDLRGVNKGRKDHGLGLGMIWDGDEQPSWKSGEKNEIEEYVEVDSTDRKKEE